MGRTAAFFFRESSREPVELFFQCSLLGLLASGFSALVGSGALDLPTVLLTTLGIALRAVLIAANRQLNMAVRWVTAATLGYAGFYPLDCFYLSRDFTVATVHLICFLAVLRILTARTDRDYFFVKLIAFLEIAGATLLSENLFFFGSLAAFLLFGVGTYCCTEIRLAHRAQSQQVLTPRGFYRRLITLTAGISIGIVAMTAMLFFIIPRTARSAFQSLVPKTYHIAGFSNEVRLGDIGQLQQSATPLLHVQIRGAQQQNLFKWRGAVLATFDGKRWFNPRPRPELVKFNRDFAILASDAQRRRRGTRIDYEVRYDDTNLTSLFFVGLPEFLQRKESVVLKEQGETYWSSGFLKDSGYHGWSFLPESDPDFEAPPLSAVDREEYLRLPKVDDRVLQLARQVGQGSTAYEQAMNIERYLRTNFAYTTDLLKTEVPDPLAYFLCDRRAGHCEYFASGMAVMLRALSVPSRVVTGFQSGVYNPMTGWQVLRSSDAHSWVEGWIEHRGWVTFDPTPPANRGQQQSPLAAKLALYLDAAETFWQRWVVHYNIEYQLTLASRVLAPNRFYGVTNWLEGWGRTGAGRLSQGLARGVVPFVWAISFAVLAYFAVPSLMRSWRDRMREARIRRGAVANTDAALLYRRMLVILERDGFQKPAWATPQEFAQLLPDSPQAVLVSRFTAEYQELRYAGRAEAARRMLDVLGELQSARVYSQGTSR